jgi:hypothetical protein
MRKTAVCGTLAIDSITKESDSLFGVLAYIFDKIFEFGLHK